MIQRIVQSDWAKVLLPVAMAVLLVACGGGSAGTDVSPTSSTSKVTIAWDAPVAREDESPLKPGEIAGYRVYYGTEQGNYPNRIDVPDGTAVQATLTNIGPGTYYIVVTVYDLYGRESEYSSMVTKTVL